MFTFSFSLPQFHLISYLFDLLIFLCFSRDHREWEFKVMSFEDSKKMQYPSSSFSGMDIKSFSENYFSVQESWVTDRHSRKKAGRKGRSSKLYWIKKHYFLFSLFLLFVAAIVALGVYGIITFIETEKRKDPKYQCPEGFVLSDCQRADFQDFLHWEKPIGFIMEDENVYDQGIAFRVLFQYAQNVALYHSSMDNKYAVRSFVYFLQLVNLQF